MAANNSNTILTNLINSSNSSSQHGTDLLERQKLEIQALASIYGDRFQFVDDIWQSNSITKLTKTPSQSSKSKSSKSSPSQSRSGLDIIDLSQRTQPFHFQITIVPHPGDDEKNYAAIVMEVTLPRQYPKQPPIIQIEKGQGVSKNQLKVLQNKITRDCAKLLGGEMIYQLADSIQGFLIDHNHKQISFHEQMIEREKKEAKEKKKLMQLQRQQHKQREKIAQDGLVKKIEEEKKKKEQALTDERKRKNMQKKKNNKNMNDDKMNPLFGNKNDSINNDYNALKKSEQHNEQDKQAQRVTKEREREDAGKQKEKERTREKKKEKDRRKQKQEKERRKQSNDELLFLPSLSFQFLKPSLPILFNKNKKIDEGDDNDDDERHEGDRGDEGDGEGNEEDGRNTDYQKEQEDDDEKSEEDEKSVENDEESEESEKEEKKKGDDDSNDEEEEEETKKEKITQKKKEVNEKGAEKEERKSKKKIVTHDEKEKLKEKEKKKKEKEEKKKEKKEEKKKGRKWKKENEYETSEDENNDSHDSGNEHNGDVSDNDILDHHDDFDIHLPGEQYTKTKNPKSPNAIAETKTTTKIKPRLSLNSPSDRYSERKQPSPTYSLTKTQSSYSSRFDSDFEVLGLLGRGGFGEVYKVRNKLDGLTYAIKRIKLKRQRTNKKIMREVSTIARLHHRYIVRYYQAWIEGGDGTHSFKAHGSDMDGFSSADEDWMNPSASLHDNSDDDDDDDDESTSDDSKGTEDGMAYSRKKLHQHLYIQMEYCKNKTLRDLIDERTLANDKKTIWKMFRQIIEAISHIHNKGILHRDIKPPNIFIDSQGNIKLGDFGLAVISSNNKEDSDADSDAHNTNKNDPDVNVSNNQAKEFKYNPAKDNQNKKSSHKKYDTGDDASECVGTPFYRSPEQEAGGEFDHKSDMYSLGIIFFEMWRQFSTNMERATQLTKLRQTGRVPSDFEFGEDVKKIVEWLLQKNPRNRPSAQELLRSGLIPINIEDEYMDLALKSVTNRDSPFHSRLMDTIFSSESDDLIDFTFDYTAPRNHNNQRNAPSHLRHLAQMQAFDRVIQIFRNHGAVFYATPLIAPKTSKVPERSHTAFFLDPTGILVQLPYTLTIPFARFLAQRHTHGPQGSLSEYSIGNSLLGKPGGGGVSLDFRRYDISKVYRQNSIGGRPNSPKEFYECDFDIVWPNKYLEALRLATAAPTTKKMKDSKRAAQEKSAVLEAEVIKVVDEIMHEFEPVLGRYNIRVSHLDIFDLVVDKVLSDFTVTPLVASLPSSSVSVPSFPLSPAHSSAASVSSSVPVASLSSASSITTLLPLLSPTVGGSNQIGTQPTTSHNVTNATGSSTLLLLSSLQSSSAPSLSATTSPSSSSTYSQSNSTSNLFSSSFTSSSSSSSLSSVPSLNDIKSELRKEICNLAGQRQVGCSWQKSSMRRQLLQKRMTIKQVDLLGSLCSLQSSLGKPESIFPKLRQYLSSEGGNEGGNPNESNDKLNDAIEALQTLFDTLELFGIKDRIVFDVGLVANYDLYHGGLVFQAVVHTENKNVSLHPQHEDANRKEGQLDVFALGGRYDSLIRKFTPPYDNHLPLSAVGVNIAIEKIISILVSHQINEPKIPLIRRQKHRESGRATEVGGVLLYCPNGNMLKERSALACQLWAENFNTQYMHCNSLTIGNIRQYCKEMGIRWLVIFRPREYQITSLVEVRDLNAEKVGSESLGSSRNKMGSGSGYGEYQWQVKCKDLCVFLRGRFSSQRKQASSGLNIEIIDPFSSLKVPKTHDKDMSNIRRLLGSVVSGSNSGNVAVCAIRLPITAIRQITTAFYKGNQENVIDPNNNKIEKVLQEHLVKYITQQIKDAKDDPLPRLLYIYSMLDRKADLITVNS